MKSGLNSLKLLVLCASLVSVVTLGCKGEHQPRVVKNGNDRTGNGRGNNGGGSSKPISERGYNAVAYTYLTTAVAKNAVRLLSLALHGTESPELLKCQTLTKKNEKNGGKEFQLILVSNACEMNMSGQETLDVTKNSAGEVETLASENARGLEFSRKRSSPSNNDELTLTVLTKKMTLTKTATGVYALDVLALLDTSATRGKKRFTLNQNIDLKLTGSFDFRQNDLVLFQLTESNINHSILKSNGASNTVETRITRAGDFGTNPQMAFTCGTVSSLYQVEQKINIRNKDEIATPQIGVTDGIIKNLVSNMVYAPKKSCGLTLVQIAEALSMASILDRAENFSALGEARRRMGRDPERRDRRDRRDDDDNDDDSARDGRRNKDRDGRRSDNRDGSGG